ncbi:MAG: sigma-70 family RNA polymerase sigma factor [Firmicutes bacterium]|nr:sigma-70 family RNA polymerase sigma factor [Bacillota bacterium]
MALNNQKRDLYLLNCARSGDEAATEDLVRKYIPMVRHIVRTTCPYNTEDQEDMIQEGMIGLLDAIREYDIDQQGVKFSSFAYICIIRKIYNWIRRQNNSKHKPLLGPISLHSYIDQDETRTILDIISNESVNPEDVVEEQWVREQLLRVLKNHLSLLEYAVVVLLVRGYTLGEIERKIGVDAKSVDNARTRVRFKLERILRQYGSLVNPSIPQKVRKRKDLYLEVNMGG